MTTTLRAFVAFKPPDAILHLGQELQDQLRISGLKLRWVKPPNIHLTLKFLGEMPVADIAKVTAAMQSAAHGQAPLELTLQGMGAFPGIKRPRILWIGLGGELDRLQRLVQRLETELEPFGFAREGRPFKAHLTLARIKERLDPQRLLQVIQELGSYSPLGFRAEKMVLYQSQLSPGGALYAAKAHVALG
jgi:RNA 2',3'-cyclic 3'-phosphodiesterase